MEGNSSLYFSAVLPPCQNAKVCEEVFQTFLICSLNSERLFPKKQKRTNSISVCSPVELARFYVHSRTKMEEML